MGDFAWYPHPGPQMEFCQTWEDEVLYGGAAGGGKTDCLIIEATRHINFPDYKGIIFRRTFPQMLEILDRARTYYPVLGGEYKASEHRWHFPGGATIQFGHMAEKDSHYNYQTFEFQYIGFDEAGQFLPIHLSYLFSRNRTKNPNIPKRIRYAANPGGPSHQYLKDRFRIKQYPKGGVTFAEEVTFKNPFTGEKVTQTVHRRFVPALVWDNPSIMDNDPTYIAMLHQLTEIEKMRLLEGNWDSFAGQMFSELNEEVHGFDGELPYEWETFGAFDWGYARPWAYGLFRVDYNGRIYLDRLHYGAKHTTKSGDENIGLRQTDTEIARTILAIEKEHKIKPRWRVAGPDIFNPKRNNKTGIMGPSPAEEMGREGIHFIKADDARVIGWQQMHHRLAVDEEGLPWFYARKDLEHFWRTMANLQEDPNRPEDAVRKDIEDHIAEMCRYACMTRPMRPKRALESDAGSFQAERRKYIKMKQFAARKGISLDAAYRQGR